MPDEITLSRSVSNGCATFTINNLLIDNEGAIDESNFKIYDVFVETGDGNFISFFTREVATEEGTITYNSQFTYKYGFSGTFKPITNMKAIYSDDGDPTYAPGAPVVIGSLTDNCPKLVENKISLPEVKTGPRVARSHMPKFGERNTYIINYERLVVNQSFQDTIFFFYNQKGKKVGGTNYQQWNAILDTDELGTFDVSRFNENVSKLAAGTVAEFSSLFAIDFRTTPQDVGQQVNVVLEEYTHYVAFKIDDSIETKNLKNIFFNLTGHNQLETALTIPDKTKPETLQVSAVHFYTPQQPPTSQQPATLYGAAVFTTNPEPLTRFHDPNYIKVNPATADLANSPMQEFTYAVSCSNDGGNTANYVEIKAYVDFGFFDVQNFDLDSITTSMPFPGDHVNDFVEITTQYISFKWPGIALMGSGGDESLVQSKLRVQFKLKPKAVPAKRTFVSAFAEVIMGVGDIRDTTPTPNRALIKVISSGKPGKGNPGQTDPSQRPGKDPAEKDPKPGNKPTPNKGCNLGCSVFLIAGLCSLWWMV